MIASFLQNRRHAPGWSAPMFWFAWVGVMVSVFFGLNAWAQNIVLAWMGWVVLWLCGCVGTAAIGYDSLRNLLRFGPRGFARPRFFFELSRLTLALAFLLAVPALTLGLFFPNVKLPVWLAFDVVQFMSLVTFLCILMCVFSAAGCLLSLVTGRRRRGRAYECATWFGGVFGGIALITAGAIAIPEKPHDVQAILPGLALCSIGIALLVFGFASEIARARRADERVRA